MIQPVKAETPEEEERVCNFIAGMAFAALEQGWHDAAVGEGFQAGARTVLQMTAIVLGKEAALQVAAEMGRRVKALQGGNNGKQ